MRSTLLLLLVVLPGLASDSGAGEEEILPRPFTAEEIRDEWIKGFTITTLMTTPAGELRQRWRVVSWNEEGVETEIQAVNADGEPAGEAARESATWVELRNHASFPASSGSREKVTRSTALGELEGWLYTVRDDQDGTAAEYFFARDLPGAPVQVRLTRGDEVIMEMTQVERHRPAVP